MLCTLHGNDIVYVTNRSKSGPEVKVKPAVVQNYNDHMGDVDRRDQLLCCYAFSRKA